MLRPRSSGHAPHDEADDGPRPRKQRKQRPCFSCAECRRLKMKCNRQVPCSNCIRRNRVKFCIAATNGKESGEQESHDETAHQSLSSHEQDISLHNPVPEIDPTIHSGDDSHHPPVQNDHGSLGLLTHALEVYAAPDHSPRTLASEPLSRTTQNLQSVHSTASVSSSAPRQPADDVEQNGSFGTLMLGKRGRSKYLGPTAGTEWLNESEMHGASESPFVSRAQTPELHGDSAPHQSNHLAPHVSPITFPFNGSAARIRTRDLLSCLPPREEAWTLAESYYRYCAWHHDVAPKPQFEKTFDRVYKFAETGSSSHPINAQEIALVFIIMAQGTMFNIEMPECDSSTEDWLHLSERALVKGDFLSNNTVAGLQTLHLMAHLHLQLDKGRRGDNAWPLWGLVMRLIQAMGMHRDGNRWNLPHDIVEERRKVFWECNTADIFQAHCFSRPSAINPDHCDTEFPSEPLGRNGEKSYSILRFELSQLSSKILSMTMKVRKPEYAEVTDLDLKLCEFEHNIPFSLRCRAALLAMPSRYSQVEAAIYASPEPSKRALAISFQQTNMALNISETIINLHRPYYAKVLYDVDGINSVYKSSFYTVIERCALIISIVTDIHTRFPAVSTRQWNFWYHVFGSALCLGTLVLRDPGNVMADFVLAQIDAAISLFTSLLQHGVRTPRYKRNLQWLLNLRNRVLSKISSVSPGENGDRREDAGLGRPSNVEDEGETEDVELLGWRTRLIERVGQGRQKTIRTKTISFAVTPTDSQNTDSVNQFPTEHHIGGQPESIDMAIPGSSLPMATLDSTDDLLRDFWDPMLLRDVFGVPDDQPNFMLNRTTWWDDIPTTPDAVHHQRH